MAYGRKNHVKLDPLAYNICLIGESKIGKTTLIYEVCRKLAGEDGYIFAEIGLERGADAIEGINYVNCPAWDMPYDEDNNNIGFADLVDDIVENKTTDYKDLRVLVIDTYDQLINISEDKSISLWNRANQEKKTNSINAAWGGFGRGEKKAMELMFAKIAELRSVGVATIVIGHVKTKDVVDVVTGETYQTLTSDQQQNYFNALKKNMHILGLAYIDREIVKEKTGKKDKEQKDIMKGKVVSESRKIKFRDDTYCVDSGGRFADIVSEIPLNSDAFIEAINNAILAEQQKSNQTLDEAKKEQASQNEQFREKVAERETLKKNRQALAEILKEIVSELQSRKNPTLLNMVMDKCKSAGFENPAKIDNIEFANQVKQIIKEYK